MLSPPLTLLTQWERLITSEQELRTFKVAVLRQYAADVRERAETTGSGELAAVVADLLESRAARIEAGELDYSSISAEEFGADAAGARHTEPGTC